MALTWQPIRVCPQHSGETGTRLTTAIHRRLFSRFFSEGEGTSVHRLRLSWKPYKHTGLRDQKSYAINFLLSITPFNHSSAEASRDALESNWWYGHKPTILTSILQFPLPTDNWRLSRSRSYLVIIFIAVWRLSRGCLHGGRKFPVLALYVFSIQFTYKGLYLSLARGS